MADEAKFKKCAGEFSTSNEPSANPVRLLPTPCTRLLMHTDRHQTDRPSIREGDFRPMTTKYSQPSTYDHRPFQHFGRKSRRSHICAVFPVESWQFNRFTSKMIIYVTLVLIYAYIERPHAISFGQVRFDLRTLCLISIRCGAASAADTGSS